MLTLARLRRSLWPSFLQLPLRILRILLLVVVLLLMLASAAVGWLLLTEKGLQTSAQLIERVTADQVKIDGLQGTTLGRIKIARLRLKTVDFVLEAEQVELEWNPAKLWQQQLQVERASLGVLRIVSSAATPATPPPTQLTLPLALDVRQIRIARLGYDQLSVNEIKGYLQSDGRLHRLELEQANIAFAETSTRLRATLRLDGNAPPTLNAQAELTGQLETTELEMQLRAQGPLDQISLTASAQKGVQGEIKIMLTPFAPLPFSEAHIAVDAVDPAAWIKDAPSARLTLRADFAPKAASVAEGSSGPRIVGRFSLHNAQAGRLDQQRLPITKLSGEIDGQGDQVGFENLQASLIDQGKIVGRGRWDGKSAHLSLDLALRDLNVAKIHDTLRATRLNGSLAATLGQESRTIKLDVHETGLQLRAEATHSAQKIVVKQLEVIDEKTPRGARLSAQGELALEARKDFKLAGSVRDFDLARFAKLPATRLSAQFSAQGKLAAPLTVRGKFELKDSQWAGQPLSGQGQFTIEGQNIRQADIELAAGPNRFNTHGAWGQAKDVLNIAINAPDLAPYGLEGGLKGQLALSGTWQHAGLTAQLEASKLGWPGRGRVSGVQLSAQISQEASAPLSINLAIEQIDTPAQNGALKKLRLQAEGRREAHRLSGEVDGMGNKHLDFSAEGGLRASEPSRPAKPSKAPRLAETFASWRGQLQSFRLTENLVPSSKKSKANAALNVANAPLAQLLAPAPLRISSEQWEFGPANFAYENAALSAQATIQAEADQKSLSAHAEIQGDTLGKLSAKISAGMHSAWAIDPKAHWQGTLKADLNELSWLAKLLGDNWQSAGRLAGELTLLGTPAEPSVKGFFRGDKLSLRQSEQGLNLVNGELDVALENQLVRLQKLSFDSVLQTAPSALRLASKGKTLPISPGRLEVSGEIKLDRAQTSSADEALLKVRLERVGLWQLPEQWLVVSGEGSLSLRNAILGARGNLTVDAGYWQLAPSGAPQLSEDVIVQRADAPAKPGLRPALDVDIRTDLGRALYFKGLGLTSRLSGEVRWRAEGRDLPRASGTIRLQDGRFDAYGQSLSIERGFLSFQGLLDNPALDVLAVRRGPSVEAGVAISGSAQKPIVKLTSDPDLPEAEKLAWLILGHGSEQMSAGDASVLFSAAGQLLGNDSGGLLPQIKKGLGIDELGVRQGNLSDATSRPLTSRVAASGNDTSNATHDSILSAGKRLSSNTLLSYEQSLGKAESIVKLSIQLSRQISLVGRAGSDNALDIFYTFTFGDDARKAAKSAKKPRN